MYCGRDGPRPLSCFHPRAQVAGGGRDDPASSYAYTKLTSHLSQKAYTVHCTTQQVKHKRQLRWTYCTASLRLATLAPQLGSATCKASFSSAVHRVVSRYADTTARQTENAMPYCTRFQSSPHWTSAAELAVPTLRRSEPCSVSNWSIFEPFSNASSKADSQRRTSSVPEFTLIPMLASLLAFELVVKLQLPTNISTLSPGWHQIMTLFA